MEYDLFYLNILVRLKDVIQIPVYWIKYIVYRVYVECMYVLGEYHHGASKKSD